MKTSLGRPAAVAASGLALCVLGLVGCDGRPAPITATRGATTTGPSQPGPASAATTEPTPTEPTPTEPTPTGPVEPTPPPEMDGDDAAAAEAFVRYFYGWVNYAQATGDVKGLREQSLPSCTTCTAGSEGLEKIHDRGGSISGGGIHVLRAKATGSRSVTPQVTVWSVDVRFRAARQTVSGAGDLDGVYPAGTVHLVFQVIRGPKAWHVDEWSVKS